MRRRKQEVEHEDNGFVDDGLHTARNPYCDDVSCWCHTDVAYHDWLQHPAYSSEEVKQVFSFYEVWR